MFIPRMNCSGFCHQAAAVILLGGCCWLAFSENSLVRGLALWLGRQPQQPALTGFDLNNTKVISTRAGQSIVIYGQGFSASPNQASNVVSFPQTLSSQMNDVSASDATANELHVTTPYGVMSGPIIIRVGGQIATLSLGGNLSLAVETSFSGIALRGNSQDKVAGVMVKVPNLGQSMPTTSEGAFLFATGQTPGPLSFSIGGAVGNVCYGTLFLSTSVNTGGDTHQDEGILRLLTFPFFVCRNSATAFASAAGATDNAPSAFPAFGTPTQPLADSIQGKLTKKVEGKNLKAGQVTLQIPDHTLERNLSLNVFERERTPVRLPLKVFSSTIVQIAPAGVRIRPGAKLIFPNQDKISNDAQAHLFRLDQDMGSKTLGTFVKVGQAKVSADGKWVETEAEAIKETGYYFVSAEWKVATLAGRVLEKLGNGQQRPVAMAIVNSRGQFTRTDGTGNFVLESVPVVGSGAPATVETALLRPDGNVLTTERGGILVTAERKTSVDDLVLPSRPLNHPPVFVAPSSLEIRAGQSRNFGFKVKELNNKKLSRVSVSGAAFAFVTRRCGENYRLHLTPSKAIETRTYQLTLTAIDSLGVRTLHVIEVKVNK